MTSSTITEEEDDNDDNTVISKQTVDRHEALIDDVLSSHKKGEAMAYLLRYETMVRQQEAEDMAVMAHISPCVDRLLQLAGKEKDEIRCDDLQFLTQEISFVDLQLTLRKLEQEHLSGSNNRVPTEHFTTDRQLMMVLRLLTQKVDSHNNNDEYDTEPTMISWAEVIQCYKVCIVGMMTLQHLPADTAIRARARDRTLAMLSLFESPSTQLFHEDAMTKLHQTVDQAPLSRGFVSTKSDSNRISNNGNSNLLLGKRKSRRRYGLGAVILTVAFVVCFQYRRNFLYAATQSLLLPAGIVSTDTSRISHRSVTGYSGTKVLVQPENHMKSVMEKDAIRACETTVTKQQSKRHEFDAIVQRRRFDPVMKPFLRITNSVASAIVSAIDTIERYSFCLEQQCDFFDL